jgi:hypothetical protein
MIAFLSRSEITASEEQQGAVVWGNERVRWESRARGETAGLCTLRQAPTEAVEKIHPVSCLCQ